MAGRDVAVRGPFFGLRPLLYEAMISLVVHRLALLTGLLRVLGRRPAARGPGLRAKWAHLTSLNPVDQAPE
jgi:hypothetical protein